MCRLLAVLPLLAVTLISIGSASTLTGNIYTDLYGFSQQDTTHLRFYSGLRASWQIRQDKEARGIELLSSLRWTTDFSNRLPIDPQLYVREQRLRLSNVIPGTQLDLGRQFSYNVLQGVLLDGLRVRRGFGSNFSAEFFGGTSVSHNEPDKIQSLSDFGVAGARIGFSPRRSLSLGANWIYRKYRGETMTHLAGIDVNTAISSIWQLYSRADYNVSQNRLSRFTGRVSVRQGKWYSSGEYTDREPSVSDAGIFSIIRFDRYSQSRIEVRRTIWRNLSVGGQVIYTVNDRDDSWRALLMLSSNLYTVGWSHQEGYGGTSDGLYGSFSARLIRGLEAYATVNLDRYQVQSEQIERSDSYTTTLGLQWRDRSGFAIRAESQIFRNAVSTSDARIYLRLTKDFSLGTKSGESVAP